MNIEHYRVLLGKSRLSLQEKHVTVITEMATETTMVNLWIVSLDKHFLSPLKVAHNGAKFWVLFFINNETLVFRHVHSVPVELLPSSFICPLICT